MNLQTLISYKEFCFLGRTRAATNGPDESRRAQQGVARRFLARGWVQCTNRCPPEAGFSQSRRASPEAHQSRPNLPVSRCRFPFAFCRTTAPSEPDTECWSLRVKIRHSAQQEHLDPLVPASPSASQPPVLKLRGLAASIPYRAASNIHGAGIFAKLTFANKDQSLPP